YSGNRHDGYGVAAALHEQHGNRVFAPTKLKALASLIEHDG
ncbi:DUF523 domain-containing protein, partial [Burkholderia pseudomallei]